MPYYHECTYCKGSLDPGESCDCQKERKEAERASVSTNSNSVSIGYRNGNGPNAQTTRRTVFAGLHI